MAVANVDDLPYLLAAGAIAMLLINPIYSWVVSKTNLRKIVIYCYSFLIVNLLIFLSTWKFLGIGDSVWVGRIFYVWCNVYSFFVVSIFWVVIINIFRNSKTRSFYGVIMAGGSLGDLFKITRYNKTSGINTVYRCVVKNSNIKFGEEN